MSPQHLNLFMKYHQGAKIFFFFCLTPFHIKYCYTTTGGEPGEPGGRGVSQGRYTPYNGLDGEAPPKRGICTSDIERVQVSLVEVHERVGKFIIVIGERT